MFTDFKIFIFVLLIGAFVFQFFIFTTWFWTTVSSMSDSESSDDGLSENEELGHDEEMEDDGSEWEDASSDEDDDEPPVRRVRQELIEGYDTADTYRPAVPFNPRRPTGPQLADQTRQDAILRFSKEVDFFKLFFSVALLQKLWNSQMPMPRNTFMTIQPIKTKPKAGIWYLSVKCMVLLPAWFIWASCSYFGKSITGPLHHCIIGQWQLGLSYDFLQGQV